MRKAMTTSITSLAALLALVAIGTTRAADTAPAPDKAAETGTITGVVTDADGKPVADMMVRVLPQMQRGRRGQGGPGGGGAPNGGGQPLAIVGGHDATNMEAPDAPTPPADKPDGDKPDGDKPAGDRPARGDRPQMPKPIAEGKTDADGKFTLEDVPVGTYSVIAGDREQREKGMGFARRVEVKSGEKTDVEIKMRPQRQRGNGGGGGGGGRPNGGNGL